MARNNRISTLIHSDFSGGVNTYLGPRQVGDNESPQSSDVDFKGKGGVGNRLGFTQVSTPGIYTGGIYGMAEYHTSALDQLIKIASDGANTVLSYSTGRGSSWTPVTGTKFTDATNMDLVQAVTTTVTPYVGADGTLFSFNGVDAMSKFNGSSWSSHTGGKVLFYGEYFDSRLWGVDPTYKDTLWFSTKTPDASNALHFSSNGTSSNFGTITFTPGAGTEIVGLKVFKNSLYVFTRKEIYNLVPASSANTYTITLVTAAIGCVSHRSIEIVENDVFFASDYGVFSIGEVGTFTSVRGTNRSLRVQTVFDALSGASKKKLAAKFFNYKYHLFYSQFGTNNDSCLVYDIRYQAWQSWTNIAGNSATRYIDSAKKTTFFFGHPTNGKVQELYNGATDDGTAISSVWYSKSFDNGIPDILKLFFYADYIFGSLSGSVSVAVIFNDSEINTTTTITQQSPQGGFGRNTFGQIAFGDATNTVSVASVINLPLRLKAKGQKFAVQYRVTSTGNWRLDGLGQALMQLTNFKFPASQKLN